MKVGFVGVRFAGLDGVSLESLKIAEVLSSVGHEVAWFAGEIGPEFTNGVEAPAARFDSPENLELQRQCFGVDQSSPGTTETIRDRAAVLHRALQDFVSDHSIDVFVPQNALSIPMQLPLGVALADMVADGMPMVAHHHDFAWERERFSRCGAPDIVSSTFPPVGGDIRHVVINSIAQRELLARRGVHSTILPNVMDFEHPPAAGDGALFRRFAGLSDSDVVLLQPTRIIPRKSIELTLELAAALGDPAVKVVISHPERDEGDEYANLLVRLADELGVDLRMVAVGTRGQPGLADAYAGADLVTYPSDIEGFGNALLEAVFYRRPVLVNRYPVYVADIAPVGLRCIEMDGAITADTVAQVQRWLADGAVREAAVASNYEICADHFSYAAVQDRFVPLLDFTVS